MAAIMAWLTANQVWFIPLVLAVLAALGIKNTDAGQKFKDWISGLLDKAGTTTGDAKSKMAAAGDDLKATFESILTDVGAVKDDISATALDLSTRALYRHYIKRVATDDQTAVDTAFQSLMNINAKLAKQDSPTA